MKSHSPGVDPSAALIGLKRWTAASAILLILVTYPLWFPLETTVFPQVPLFEFFCATPHWVDACLLLTIIIGLVMYIAWGVRFTAAASLIILASGLGLILLNQHRLQPWFYQLLMFAVVYLAARKTSEGEGNTSLKLLQTLVISIYFYSALGKFDFEFFHTVGQTFLGATLASVGLNIGDWSAPVRLAAVAVLPIAEFLLAVSLFLGLFRRNSTLLKLGGVAACIFHLALVALLGLALKHSFGVVVWNLQFAGQALLLFVLPDSCKQLPDTSRAKVALGMTAWPSIVVGLAILMPIVERIGYWDHWPSWALYAPHSSRVEVFVAATATEKLPEELQELLIKDEATLWVRLPLAKWSLAETGTPVYPQARFELGVARQMATILDSEFTVRATILSVANRLNGRRAAVELPGATEIHKAKGRFLFNTRPRGH